MAGFAAGVTEALCIVTPFEVVKIRLQQQKGMAKDKLLYKVSLPNPAHSPALPAACGRPRAFSKQDAAPGSWHSVLCSHSRLGFQEWYSQRMSSIRRSTKRKRQVRVPQ